MGTKKSQSYPITVCAVIIVAVLCMLTLSRAIAEEAEQNDTIPVKEQNRSVSQTEPNDPNAPPSSPTQDNEASEDPNQPPAEDENGDSMMPDLGDIDKLNTLFGRIFNEQFIAENGGADYAQLRRKRVDLLKAVNAIETLHPAILMSLSKEERIAFWINTYNTCTLKLIIDNYPIQAKWYMIVYPSNSIMQIPGAWDKVFFKIMGLEYNLKEIRFETLLDRYKDPRICFALNDVARGGALLRNEPIQAKKLDEQLDDQVRRFLAVTQGVRLDIPNNTVYLSNLFSMNKSVFLASEYAAILKFRTRKLEERAWLNFLFKYLPPKEAAWLDSNDVTIRFIDYDWNLNEK